VDTRTGVDDSYTLPFRFTGTIDKLTFKLGPSQLSAEEQKAAANAIAKSIGLKTEPEIQEPYDEALAEVRKKLSEEDFQSAWLTGEAMDMERAVKFATK